MFGSRNKEKKELIDRVMNREAPIVPPASGPKALDRRWWIFIGVVVPVILALIIGINTYYYNWFVNLAQEIRDARANVETALQLRENMVPAILTSLIEFMSHENEIFIHAADVRARSLENKPQPSDESAPPSSMPVPADEWDKLLSELFAIAESYPDLKTGEPFQLLMTKISDAEMEIMMKRVQYNEKVRNYNIVITTFPAVVFSYMFKRKPEQYFQWKGTPEWVSMLDEERRKRIDEILEKWRSNLMDK